MKRAATAYFRARIRKRCHKERERESGIPLSVYSTMRRVMRPLLREYKRNRRVFTSRGFQKGREEDLRSFEGFGDVFTRFVSVQSGRGKDSAREDYAMRLWNAHCFNIDGPRDQQR